ncbi:MAG: hypothetical protein IPM48_14845 [Saprospiraceae bacterium]|nr:hypothetical protein [Saprospiraceae bacterium]
MLNPYQLQTILKKRDIVEFIETVLGIPLHDGQKYWLQNAVKKVNILKPANQWGKTTSEALVHIFQAVNKPYLDRFNMTHEDKHKFEYLTLNAGKTYEIAQGVQEAIVAITEGEYLLPDGSYNKSLLKGWAITRNVSNDSKKLPEIVWWNGSRTLIRSYDGLGEGFKRLRIAFISVDECGDIPELRLFLNGTLIPRTFFFAGSIHLIGTSQPKGIEYEEITEEAEEDIKQNKEASGFFVLSASTNPDMANIYQNKFMPQDEMRKLENIADPELKKQIMYGLYVSHEARLYTYEEVSQMFKNDMPWNEESGFSEEPVGGGYYVFSVDLAASKDETSSTCIRYNIFITRNDEKIFLPHRVVFHRAWKGSTYPLSVQYEMIKSDFKRFRAESPHRTKFVYDAGGLGGKNAEEAFKELHGYPFPPKGRSYAEIKAEGMGMVKEVLGRNRRFTINEDGKMVDENPDWGGVKASPKLKELRRQLEISSKKDDKIKNDQYTSFMQAIHFIERRAPKAGNYKAVDFNLMGSMVG